MTPLQILEEVEEYASEYLPEVNEPRDLIVAVLANKLANALNHIEYLERRLQHVSTSRN
jgi:hypothetical protein